MPEGDQKGSSDGQSVREIVNRIGQQVQITSDLLGLLRRHCPRRSARHPIGLAILALVLREEASVGHVLQIAAAIAGTSGRHAFGDLAAVLPHQTVGDLDAPRLRIVLVGIRVAREDLLDDRKDEDARQQPHSRSHRRVLPLLGALQVMAPGLRQQVQEHVAQQATHGETQEYFQGFGFGRWKGND